MAENAIAREVVDAAFRVHGRLGPGLLESVYESVLAHELNRRGLQTTSQQPIPVVYVRSPTYIRLADKRLGLLINFNVNLIKEGITRIVKGLEEGKL